MAEWLPMKPFLLQYANVVWHHACLSWHNAAFFYLNMNDNWKLHWSGRWNLNLLLTQNYCMASGVLKYIIIQNNFTQFFCISVYTQFHCIEKQKHIKDNDKCLLLCATEESHMMPWRWANKIKLFLKAMSFNKILLSSPIYPGELLYFFLQLDWIFRWFIVDLQWKPSADKHHKQH